MANKSTKPFRMAPLQRLTVRPTKLLLAGVRRHRRITISWHVVRNHKRLMLNELRSSTCHENRRYVESLTASRRPRSEPVHALGAPPSERRRLQQ
jgi:hypothetical protein